MSAPLSHQFVGRWKGIVQSFGVEEKYLTGKHCPCPICGGKDRFRWIDKNGEGTWFCEKCRAGDGPMLIMGKTGLSFLEAAAKIREIADAVRPERSQPKKKPSDEERRRRCNELWRSSHPVRSGDAVDRYLLARGLTARPAVLRTVDRLRYYAETPSWYSGMIARVDGPNGQACTIHRTYLGEGCKADVPAPRRLMPGPIVPGAAVRLTDPAEELGIAEGIETALAATVLHGIPCWAALCAAGLAGWIPPVEASRIVVFGDNDVGFAGQAAAYALARRLAGRVRAIEVVIPADPGTDWNGVLYAKSPECMGKIGMPGKLLPV